MEKIPTLPTLPILPTLPAAIATPSPRAVSLLDEALSQKPVHGDVLTYHGKGKLAWTPTQLFVDTCVKVAEGIVGELVDKAMTAYETRKSRERERKRLFDPVPHDPGTRKPRSMSPAPPTMHLSKCAGFRGRRTMQVLANSSQNTLSAVGLGQCGAPQLLAPSSCPPVSADSVDGPFVSFRNISRDSPSLPAPAGFTSAVFNTVRVAWNPEFVSLIRVHVPALASASRSRYWIGLSDTDLKSIDPSSCKAKVHRIIAFYLDTADPSWYCVTSSASSSSPTIVKTNVQLVKETVYELAICIRDDGRAEFYINGSQVSTQGDLPDKACSLGYVVEASRWEASGYTQIDFSRMSLSY